MEGQTSCCTFVVTVDENLENKTSTATMSSTSNNTNDNTASNPATLIGEGGSSSKDQPRDEGEEGRSIGNLPGATISDANWKLDEVYGDHGPLLEGTPKH